MTFLEEPSYGKARVERWYLTPDARFGSVLLNARQGARNFAEGRADFGTKGCNGHDADHGDQADKHTVFDQGRALVVTAEAID
jgi:hypothetical protein